MSGRLVGEVVEWLRTPAAADLTAAERVVLLVIAERSSEATRGMWRHKVDDVSLSERIREATGVSRQNLTKVFNRLAERGLEVRVQVGARDSGKPVFAHKGHATDFRLPDLPASVQLPQSDAQARRIEPVDNSPAEAPETLPEPPQRDAQTRRYSAKGTPRGVAKRPKGTPRGVALPSKDLPSTTYPSTPVVPAVLAEVEDTRPAAATPSGEPKIHMGYDPTYKEARAVLGRLPDLGGTYMAAARDALGQETPLAELVIYAGQLAKEAS
jgi:hypothetical protein